MAVIPLQGTPGVRDHRNPTLVPNFDLSVDSGAGTIDHQSPLLYLQNNPRADAAITATVGGTVTTGDSIGLVFGHALLPNGQLGVAYSAAAGDSVSNIAQKLCDAINDSTVAAALQLRADSVRGVITVHWSGPVGNFATLLGYVNAATVTLTITGSATQGDWNVVQFIGPNFNGGVAHQVATLVPSGRSTTNQAVDIAAAINADTLLIAGSITATSGGNVVSIAVPTAVEPLTIASWPAPALETLVVGGSIVNGDSGIVTFTNPALAGSPLSLTIPIGTADTATTVAAKVAAAVNGNAALAAIGLNAISSGANVDFTMQNFTGPTTFARTNGSSITFTLAGGAPETIVIGGTISAGDSQIIAITAGGVKTSLTIPVVGTDTTATIAAKLNVAINSSLALAANGFASTVSSSTISIWWPNTIGAVTFASTNGSAITGTLGGGPTEIINTGNAGITETCGVGAASVAFASETALIGGSSFVSADTVALIFTNAGVTGFPVTATYTVGAGSSAAIIAAGLAALINGNATLQAANLTASVNVATITVQQPGTLAISTVITDTIAGTGNETVTFGHGGNLSGGTGAVSSALTGGSGPVIPTDNFSYSMGGQATSFWYGKPAPIDNATLTNMVAQRMPVS